MKKSSLAVAEVISKQLLFYPGLVDKLGNKDDDFVSSLMNWLKELEILFKDYNISESAEVAGLRSKILAPLFGDSTRRAAKKAQLKIAAEVLYDIQQVAQGILRPHEQKVNEARDILDRLLGVLSQTGAVRYKEGQDFQAFINSIWSVCITHEQLKPGAIKVLTLVTQADVIRIIAEDIVLSEWM